MKEQHKLNKQRLHLLLCLFLCVGALAASVGTAYARYRSEQNEKLLFEVRKYDQLVLGSIRTVEEKETFVPLGDQEQLAWTVDEESGIASLTFAAANGSDSKNFSVKGQSVKVRMLGSLNLAATETGIPPELTITYKCKKLNGEEAENTVQGEISYLTEGTALYQTYGGGFLYTFYEDTAEGKEELKLELPGGEFSYITFTVKTAGNATGILGPLQPLLTEESIGY